MRRHPITELDFLLLGGTRLIGACRVDPRPKSHQTTVKNICLFQDAVDHVYFRAANGDGLLCKG